MAHVDKAHVSRAPANTPGRARTRSAGCAHLCTLLMRAQISSAGCHLLNLSTAHPQPEKSRTIGAPACALCQLRAKRPCHCSAVHAPPSSWFTQHMRS